LDPIEKQLSWAVKIIDKPNRIIEMIGSTEDADRAGDRMFVMGAKLENYLKNPIILANHNHGDSEVPTVIGRALAVTIQAKQLVFKIQFAETVNAKEWFYLYSEGYMKASSIGFIPITRTPNDKGGYDFTSWELLELSLVTVPCNPNAVARAFETGLISKSLFDQMKTESGETKVNEEQIQALIATAIKGIAAPKDYSVELKTATDKITELEIALKAIPVVEEKGGATFSAKNAGLIKAVCDSMTEHVKTLTSMFGKAEGEPDGDEGKEYTDEQIQKAVEEKLAELMKGVE